MIETATRRHYTLTQNDRCKPHTKSPVHQTAVTKTELAAIRRVIQMTVSIRLKTILILRNIYNVTEKISYTFLALTE